MLKGVLVAKKKIIGYQYIFAIIDDGNCNKK